MFLTPLFGEWEECESERASCVKYVNQIQKIVVCGMRRVLKCYAAFLCGQWISRIYSSAVCVCKLAFACSLCGNLRFIRIMRWQNGNSMKGTTSVFVYGMMAQTLHSCMVYGEVIFLLLEFKRHFDCALFSVRVNRRPPVHVRQQCSSRRYNIDLKSLKTGWNVKRKKVNKTRFNICLNCFGWNMKIHFANDFEFHFDLYRFLQKNRLCAFAPFAGPFRLLFIRLSNTQHHDDRRFSPALRRII